MTRSSIRLKANPVLIKELRSRMRGPRAFVILTVFLLLLAGFAYGLYRLVAVMGANGGMGAVAAVVGRTVFTGLVFAELALICVLAPALTAAAVSGEAERRTLDMLLATPLATASILWGKLLSAFSYILLLIMAAVPLASIAFLYGGVTAGDMARALVMLLLAAVMCSMIGLFFSAWLRRTAPATVAAYVALGLVVVGSYFVFIFAGVSGRQVPDRALLYANPLAAMASAVGGDTQPGGLANGMAGPAMSLVWAMGGAAGASLMGSSTAALLPPLRPLWHYTAGIYLVASTALFLLSVQLLKPIRRWRVGRTGWLAFGCSVIVLIALSYGLYGPPSYATLGVPAWPTATPMPLTRPIPVQAVPAMRATEVPAPTVTPAGG